MSSLRASCAVVLAAFSLISVFRPFRCRLDFSILICSCFPSTLHLTITFALHSVAVPSIDPVDIWSKSSNLHPRSSTALRRHSEHTSKCTNRPNLPVAASSLLFLSLERPGSWERATGWFAARSRRSALTPETKLPLAVYCVAGLHSPRLLGPRSRWVLSIYHLPYYCNRLAKE